METETFTFKFTEEETNKILSALGELPARISMGLIGNIHSQHLRQTEALQELPKQKNKRTTPDVQEL